MCGFLDQRAESIEFEYAIRCEPDYLGKTVFKNFCVNILGLDPSLLEIPLSKAGSGFIGDAKVRWKHMSLDIEIKLSHLHPHKTGGDNWAFSRVTETKKRRTKHPFDLAFCVGLITRDPANENYYEHRQSLKPKKGRGYLNLNAKPYEKSFLNLCAFFILPYQTMRGMAVNDFRPYFRSLESKPYFRYYSSGEDLDKCENIWRDAAGEAVKTKQFSQRFHGLGNPIKGSFLNTDD